ncbi:MAG: hypothetical protein Terrestrivirus1_43 [Terrestrivirus sp.]|uniref:Uncharacterized protein n=1 Tax=Terrestrivirus sp. TaxID=2487775 RepID=A0A3G4ZNX5_9VIRU|nr:MAG: hypothetical protein Terrestrivirus1_43 [Terrestrivirus sp.]
MFDTIYKYHVEVYYKDGTKIVSPTMETFSMKKTAEFANKIINTDPAFISKKVTFGGETDGSSSISVDRKDMERVDIINEGKIGFFERMFG